jgi:hypothetical protein
MTQSAFQVSVLVPEVLKLHPGTWSICHQSRGQAVPGIPTPNSSEPPEGGGVPENEDFVGFEPRPKLHRVRTVRLDLSGSPRSRGRPGLCTKPPAAGLVLALRRFTSMYLPSASGC